MSVKSGWLSVIDVSEIESTIKLHKKISESYVINVHEDAT